MIVINYGLPKSASSFVYQLTASILTAAGHDQKAIRRDRLPDELRADNLPLVPEVLRILLDSVPKTSILTVKTHYPLEPLNDLVHRDQVRAIVTVRDPRDCILSLIDFAPKLRGSPDRMALMRKYPRQDGEPPFGETLGPKPEIDFDLALKRYAKLCREAMTWWDTPGFLRVTFTDVFDAPYSVARRIAAHLGLKTGRNASPGAIDTDAIVGWFLEDRTRIRRYSTGERSRYRRLMTPEQIAQCDAVLGAYIDAFGVGPDSGASTGGAEKERGDGVSG